MTVQIPLKRILPPTVTVELPRDIALKYADRNTVGGEAYAVGEACRAALESESA